jgi:hypothetical protein
VWPGAAYHNNTEDVVRGGQYVERKPENVYKRIEGISLRRSDLLPLSEIIGTRDGLGVAVESDTHNFKNPEDLIAFRGPIKKISISRVYSPTTSSASLSIEAAAITLHFHSVDDADLGAIARLESFIAQRRRRLFFVEWFGFQLLGILLAVCGLAVATILALRGRHDFASLLLVPTALSILATVFGLFRKPSVAGTISFRREVGQAEPIKWRAAGWDLAKIAFGAVFGAVVALAVASLARKDASPADGRPGTMSSNVARPDGGTR